MSVVLVAMAWLVLPGAALACQHSHGEARQGWAGASPTGGQVDLRFGALRLASDQARGAEASAPGEAAPRAAILGGPCCCTVSPAIPAAEPCPFQALPLTSATLLPVDDRPGASTGPSGLRRPPRTPGIA